MRFLARVCSLRVVLFSALVLLAFHSELLAAALGNAGMVVLVRSSVDQVTLSSAHQEISALLSTAGELSNSARWTHNSARLAIAEGDWKKARTLLEQAYLLEPDQPIVNLDLGTSYARLGAEEKAAAIWQSIGAFRPILDLAGHLAEQGFTDRSLSLLEMAVRADPRSPLVWRELGRAKMQHDWDGAGTALEKALALDPNDSWTIQMLGRVYLERKQFDRALMLAAQATENFPGQLIGPVLLGDTFVAMGRYEGAEAAYLQAIQADEHFVWTHERLASLYDRLGRGKDAVRHWQTAISLAPENWSFHAQLAETYLSLGRRNDALLELQHALELNPDDPGLRQALQQLQQK